MARRARGFGDIPTPAILTSLTGPAVFADGSQTLTVDVTTASGSYSLVMNPSPGAGPGIPPTLEVTLAGLRLEREGTVAYGLYMPLVLKNH